ncbi:MAG: two component transcriptional regulator, winged helix family, partial [Rubritepida sp.]|nr:two component transcriptional regulator, winged helix family [Rubritepida sp.]
MPGRKLLLVTTDAALAALLPPQLAQGTDFSAEATTPQAGQLRLAESAGRIDATLLDAAVLPGPSHWGPLLREAGGGRPVLLLGQAPEEDAPHILPPGISERVLRPVRLPDLVARLHALLATFEASPGAAIPLGDYAFHPAAKLMLGADSKRIRLTEKEAAILLYLHRAGGRAVPR